MEIVRLTGEPVHTPPTDDSDGRYETDLLVRVPFDSGPRDVVLKRYDTRSYFAPAHPEEGVAEYTDMGRAWFLVGGFVLVFAVPAFGLACAIAKSYMEVSDLRHLRHFRPGLHLPALAILLCGLALLLPVALECEVDGYNRLPAFLASLTPVLALTWVVRRS